MTRRRVALLPALFAVLATGCDRYTFVAEVWSQDWEIYPAVPVAEPGRYEPSADVQYDSEYGRYVIKQTFGDYSTARETGLWLRVRYRGGESFVVNLRPDFCFRTCGGEFDHPLCPAELTYERLPITPNADWSEISWGSLACGFADGSNWGSDT